MLSADAYYHTDQGHRENNEDRAAILEGRVFVVADGMGGMYGGETASSLAVETVRSEVKRGTLETPSDADAALQGLRAIAEKANQRILSAARDDPHPGGMGTTFTLAFLQQRELFFIHVGDSRLYLWREGRCEQLTEDHTQTREFVRRGWMSPEEAAHSMYRHVLVKYLGTPQGIDPQTGSRTLRAGDRILLCSDGLYEAIDPDRLCALLGGNKTARELSREMVSAARGSGRSGLDNLTALVVRFDSP